MALSIWAAASVPLAASADTYECVCKFVLTGQSCTNQADVGARATGVTVESSTPPQINDPQDPKLKACRQGCPQTGATFCSLSWVNKTPAGTGGAPTTPSRTVTLVNPLNTSSIPQIIGSIIKAAVGVVGAFALLTFVYGGFLWLTSGGEAGKVEQGKEAMKWALIGLAVVFSSYALVSFVLSALKL